MIETNLSVLCPICGAPMEHILPGRPYQEESWLCRSGTDGRCEKMQVLIESNACTEGEMLGEIFAIVQNNGKILAECYCSLVGGRAMVKVSPRYPLRGPQIPGWIIQHGWTYFQEAEKARQ